MIQKQKKKYRIEDYLTKKTVQKHVEVINSLNPKPACICGKFVMSDSVKCYRCKLFTHSCLSPKPNRINNTLFQCLTCIARNIDPIYVPQRYILQTFFQTRNIFLNENQFLFEFQMNYENLKSSVDVRGFCMKRTDLCWPMQGSFYLNNNPEPIFQLKPLLANTNRKTRREENFIIQPSKLKIGINTLKFKIPQLDATFGDNYKFEEMREYFIGIYSVNILNMQQMIQKITRQYRTEQEDTIKLMKSLNEMCEQISFSKQKINLTCPYSGNRIKFPVRGRYCKHLTCVCFQTFMTMQQGKRKWNCPICPQYINEPYVDIWLLQILNDNNKGEFVLIQVDGTYEWAQDNRVQNLDNSDSDSESTSKKIDKKVVIQEQQVRNSRKMVQLLPQFQFEINQETIIKGSPKQMVQIDQQIPNNQREDLQFLQPFPFSNDYQQNMSISHSNMMQKQQSLFQSSPKGNARVEQSLNAIQINSDNQDDQNKKDAQQKRKMIEKQKSLDKMKQLRDNLRDKKKVLQQIQKKKQQQVLLKTQHNLQHSASIQKRPPQVQYSSLQKQKNIQSSFQQQFKKQEQQNQRQRQKKSQKLRDIQTKILQKMISQIKTLSFKQMSSHQYARKYCKLPINQYKKRVNDDLKKIFKNIL